MSINVLNKQSIIPSQNICKSVPSFTSTQKTGDNNDTFISRFKNEYKKQTNTTIDKILFVLGSIGLVGLLFTVRE